MPYFFGVLLVLNVLMLGYNMYTGAPTTTQSIEQAQQQINKPVDFINSSDKLPPIIGKE